MERLNTSQPRFDAQELDFPLLAAVGNNKDARAVKNGW
jgi:hypothetical protein